MNGGNGAGRGGRRGAWEDRAGQSRRQGVEVGGQQTCWRRGPGAEGEGCFLERRQELGADCEVRNSPQDRSHF